jgi:hypothetical protein
VLRQVSNAIIRNISKGNQAPVKVLTGTMSQYPPDPRSWSHGQALIFLYRLAAFLTSSTEESTWKKQ